METRPIKGTQEWKRYSVVLDVPNDATAIRIGFTLSGSGCLWASNLAFAPAAQSVAVTGMKSEEIAKLPTLGKTLESQPENLDFSETIPDSPRPPGLSHWSEQEETDEYNIAVVKNSSYNGHPAIVVGSKRNDAAAQRLMVNFVQTFKAAEFAGSRVRFECAIQTVEAKPGAALFLGVNNPRQAVAYDTMWHRGLARGTEDWKRYSCVLDVPADASTITLGLALSGSGKVSFADASFEKVDKTVPATGKQLARTTSVPEFDWKRPVYLDFEHE
jgi:hypothetical protein